tara:strand:- start:92 stop:379 length:288 start_codon:yes stop_codon:yes gene_type:complete
MSQINDLEIQVFGVSVQGAESHRRFVDRDGLNFPLLVDVGRNLSLLFGAADEASSRTSERMAVYIDMQGRILKIEKQLNTKTHGTDLVDFFSSQR